MATSRPLPKANTVSRHLVLCAVALALLVGVAAAGQSTWTRADTWTDFVGVTLGTTEPERQRAPVHTHAYALYGYFEEDVNLPRDRLTLCGSQVRSDGTVFRWKLWAADRTEPACPEIEGS